MTTFSSYSDITSIAYCKSFGKNTRDNNMAEGTEERKERRWKCEKLSINSTGWKDGKRDKGTRRRRGKNSSVFLFNPSFVIIPLGKSSFLERKRGKGRRRGRQEGN